jgi:hypothetical protein
MLELDEKGKYCCSHRYLQRNLELWCLSLQGEQEQLPFGSKKKIELILVHVGVFLYC